MTNQVLIFQDYYQEASYVYEQICKLKQIHKNTQYKVDFTIYSNDAIFVHTLKCMMYPDQSEKLQKIFYFKKISKLLCNLNESYINKELFAVFSIDFAYLGKLANYLDLHKKAMTFHEIWAQHKILFCSLKLPNYDFLVDVIYSELSQITNYAIGNLSEYLEKLFHIVDKSINVIEECIFCNAATIIKNQHGAYIQDCDDVYVEDIKDEQCLMIKKYLYATGMGHEALETDLRVLHMINSQNKSISFGDNEYDEVCFSTYSGHKLVESNVTDQHEAKSVHKSTLSENEIDIQLVNYGVIKQNRQYSFQKANNIPKIDIPTGNYHDYLFKNTDPEMLYIKTKLGIKKNNYSMNEYLFVHISKILIQAILANKLDFAAAGYFQNTDNNVHATMKSSSAAQNLSKYDMIKIKVKSRYLFEKLQEYIGSGNVSEFYNTKGYSVILNIHNMKIKCMYDLFLSTDMHHHRVNNINKVNDYDKGCDGSGQNSPMATNGTGRLIKFVDVQYLSKNYVLKMENMYLNLQMYALKTCYEKYGFQNLNLIMINSHNVVSICKEEINFAALENKIYAQLAIIFSKAQYASQDGDDEVENDHAPDRKNANESKSFSELGRLYDYVG